MEGIITVAPVVVVGVDCFDEEEEEMEGGETSGLFLVLPDEGIEEDASFGSFGTLSSAEVEIGGLLLPLSVPATSTFASACALSFFVSVTASLMFVSVTASLMLSGVVMSVCSVLTSSPFFCSSLTSFDISVSSVSSLSSFDVFTSLSSDSILGFALSGCSFSFESSLSFMSLFSSSV